MVYSFKKKVKTPVQSWQTWRKNIEKPWLKKHVASPLRLRFHQQLRRRLQKLRCPDAKAGSNQWLNGNHQNPRGKLMILMIFEVNLDITCFFFLICNIWSTACPVRGELETNLSNQYTVYVCICLHMSAYVCICLHMQRKPG